MMIIQNNTILSVCLLFFSGAHASLTDSEANYDKNIKLVMANLRKTFKPLEEIIRFQTEIREEEKAQLNKCSALLSRHSESRLKFSDPRYEIVCKQKKQAKIKHEEALKKCKTAETRLTSLIGIRAELASWYLNQETNKAAVDKVIKEQREREDRDKKPLIHDVILPVDSTPVVKNIDFKVNQDDEQSFNKWTKAFRRNGAYDGLLKPVFREFMNERKFISSRLRSMAKCDLKRGLQEWSKTQKTFREWWEENNAELLKVQKNKVLTKNTKRFMLKMIKKLRSKFHSTE